MCTNQATSCHGVSQAVGWSKSETWNLLISKIAFAYDVKLVHLDPDIELWVCSKASDSHYGVVVTQYPVGQQHRDIESSDHESLMFLSGYFSKSASHWAIFEKDAHDTVETCRRVDCILHRDKKFTLYTDHRILPYIFDSESVVSAVLKDRAGKLRRRAMLLMGYRIRHIPGEANVWADHYRDGVHLYQRYVLMWSLKILLYRSRTRLLSDLRFNLSERNSSKKFLTPRVVPRLDAECEWFTGKSLWSRGYPLDGYRTHDPAVPGRTF